MTARLANYTESDVAEVLRYEALIPLMRETLIAFSARQAHQPVREMLPIEPEQRYFAAMAAALPTAMGAKLISFYPKNAALGRHTHQASIVLLDPEYGEPLAIVAGRLITEMRTAATSAAVSQVAAHPQSRSLALLGSGVQAKAHLEGLRTIFPLDDVRIWSRNKDHARAFAVAHGAQPMSAEEATHGADIVVCATNALEPVLCGKWLKAGAHVNSVGSPRPNWRELDDDVMSHTLLVDSREAALKEAGDVILSGAVIHAEAGEVLAGQADVDLSQTTVFKSVGMAVEDLATARLVHDLCQARS